MAKSQSSNVGIGEMILNIIAASTIFCFLFTLTVVKVQAAEISTGGIIYEVDEETGDAKVLKNLGTTSNLRVKEAVKYGSKSYPVVKIGESAFENTDAISVLLPDSVQEIGNRAFADCPFLEELNIPSGLKVVGDEAFAGTTKLRPLFPESCIISPTVYGQEEKQGSEGGNEETNPSEPEKGNEEEASSEKGEDQTGDPAVETPEPIGSATPTGQEPEIKVEPSDGQYNQSKDSATTVQLEDSFKLNGSEYELYEDGTAVLKKVNIRKKTLTIPNAVGYRGKKYKVTAIAANAAKDCYRLRKVKFGKNLLKIGQKAFAGCKKLKTIDLKKVETVGANAFAGCKNLRSVKASSSTTFEPRAFKGCKKLNASSLLK